METILQRHNVQPEQLTDSVLSSYYLLARGVMAEQGGNVAPTAEPSPQPTPPPAPKTVNTPPLNPQHSASPHPLAPENGGPQKLRPLTENEERLRRFNKMTHEEFLREQEAEGPLVLSTPADREK